MSGLKNILEEMINKELDIMYQRFTDICKCPQCRMDVIALTLNQLPPQYITGKRRVENEQQTLYAKYNAILPSALAKAIEKVKNNPRPECVNNGTSINNITSILSYYRP